MISSTILSSMVSVTCRVMNGEHIKWKTPQVKNASVLNCILFRVLWWILELSSSIQLLLPGREIIPLSGICPCSICYPLISHLVIISIIWLLQYWSAYIIWFSTIGVWSIYWRSWSICWRQKQDCYLLLDFTVNLHKDSLNI